MSERPVVIEPALPADWPLLPGTARALVLMAHPDGASLGQAGYGFVADVLRANRLAVLPICMHTHDDLAVGRPPPGMVQSKLRLRLLFSWLARQPELAGQPLALIGLGSAGAGCIAAAARLPLPGLRSLVLLDARADQVAHHLDRLNLPTLFVLGSASARKLAQQRMATRNMAAPHRVEMLGLSTQPRPACGAHQAFAHAAMGWLETTLWPNADAPVAAPLPLRTGQARWSATSTAAAGC